MAEHTLRLYKSRRNSARLVQTDGGRFVVKTFQDEERFQKELDIYSLLQTRKLPCAKVIETRKNTLILSELPGLTLVDCLQQQELAGRPHWDVWEKLVDWLCAFTRCTGLIMTDVNLRNFLYDERAKTLYGLDFEECTEGNMEIPAATVAAYIRTYKPEYTPLKQEISQYILARFARSCKLEEDMLLQKTWQQEQFLLKRRNKK